MKKSAEQKVTVEESGSVGSITQIMRLGIPTILILAVIFIAITQMTGYDLKPVIDTILYGATPTPSYPICTVTIDENYCLWISKYADYPDSERYGCLQDGAKIQVTAIADPYYEISSYGIESVFVYEDRGLFVSEVRNSSPASDAGLEYGDIILLVNDTPVTDIPDISTYLVQFAEQKISLLLKRDGQEKTLFITLPRYSSIGTYPTTYLRQEVSFSYIRINPNGLEANRGYVLGYSVKNNIFSNATVRSYVSCPAQLIQPPVPK